MSDGERIRRALAAHESTFDTTKPAVGFAGDRRGFWHVWAVFAARVAKIPEPRSSAETREPPPEQGFFRWS